MLKVYSLRYFYLIKNTLNCQEILVFVTGEFCFYEIYVFFMHRSAFSFDYYEECIFDFSLFCVLGFVVYLSMYVCGGIFWFLFFLLLAFWGDYGKGFFVIWVIFVFFCFWL